MPIRFYPKVQKWKGLVFCLLACSAFSVNGHSFTLKATPNSALTPKQQNSRLIFTNPSSTNIFSELEYLLDSKTIDLDTINQQQTIEAIVRGFLGSNNTTRFWTTFCQNPDALSTYKIECGSDHLPTNNTDIWTLLPSTPDQSGLVGLLNYCLLYQASKTNNYFEQAANIPQNTTHNNYIQLVLPLEKTFVAVFTTKIYSYLRNLSLQSQIPAHPFAIFYYFFENQLLYLVNLLNRLYFDGSNLVWMQNFNYTNMGDATFDFKQTLLMWFNKLWADNTFLPSVPTITSWYQNTPEELIKQILSPQFSAPWIEALNSRFSTDNDASSIISPTNNTLIKYWDQTGTINNPWQYITVDSLHQLYQTTNHQQLIYNGFKNCYFPIYNYDLNQLNYLTSQQATVISDLSVPQIGPDRGYTNADNQIDPNKTFLSLADVSTKIQNVHSLAELNAYRVNTQDPTHEGVKVHQFRNDQNDLFNYDLNNCQTQYRTADKGYRNQTLIYPDFSKFTIKKDLDGIRDVSSFQTGEIDALNADRDLLSHAYASFSRGFVKDHDFYPDGTPLTYAVPDMTSLLNKNAVDAQREQLLFYQIEQNNVLQAWANDVISKYNQVSCGYLFQLNGTPLAYSAPVANDFGAKASKQDITFYQQQLASFTTEQQKISTADKTNLQAEMNTVNLGYLSAPDGSVLSFHLPTASELANLTSSAAISAYRTATLPAFKTEQQNFANNNVALKHPAFSQITRINEYIQSQVLLDPTYTVSFDANNKSFNVHHQNDNFVITDWQYGIELIGYNSQTYQYLLDPFYQNRALKINSYTTTTTTITLNLDGNVTYIITNPTQTSPNSIQISVQNAKTNATLHYQLTNYQMDLKQFIFSASYQNLGLHNQAPTQLFYAGQMIVNNNACSMLFNAPEIVGNYLFINNLSDLNQDHWFHPTLDSVVNEINTANNTKLIIIICVCVFVGLALIGLTIIFARHQHKKHQSQHGSK